ncbi:MAG: translation initiation factor eIF-1A [Methanomassiliicoccales archaeon]
MSIKSNRERQERFESRQESIVEGEEGSENFMRVPLPRRGNGEMLGVADQLLGGSRIRVQCADGKARMGRIPGKIKKKMWIREGDLVIVKPWQFQEDKADILYRYTKTQSTYLSRKNLIPDTINIY